MPVDQSALSTVIGEAMGEVSMCWDPIPSGVFQSQHAAEIVRATIAAVRALYENA